jgi:hypothetical protein
MGWERSPCESSALGSGCAPNPSMRTFPPSSRSTMRCSRMSALASVRDPVEALRERARLFLAFCAEDPGRYQLLFQRTIPGFEPSPKAYAPALEVLDNAREALRACGISDARAVDMWTAITSGLAAQQISNEPGGDRWMRLTDEATDMFLAHHAPVKKKETP